MGVLKKSSFPENLDKFSVFIVDKDVDSKYFKITELEETLTGGKNAFLIQGTPNLVAGTPVKVEIKDAVGNIIYTEPGQGIPEYYEGVSKPVAIYVYPDTAFGECTVTIIGELATYDLNGVTTDIPPRWQNVYNVKWQKKIMVNPFLANTTKIRFYKRPKVSISETVLPISTATILRSVVSGSVIGTAIEPAVNGNFKTFAGDTIFEIIATGSVFSSSMEGENIVVSGLNQAYSTTIKDVVNSTTILASTPYYETQPNGVQLVQNFTSAPFQLTYTSNTNYTNSSLNASYAKIKLTDMQAFSGDPARLKIYTRRKSSIATIFTLLEDITLESDDKLQVDSYSGSLAVSTGIFSNQAVINDFWKYRDYNTPSTFYSTPYNNDIAAASVILNESNTSNSTGKPQRVFYYSSSIDFLQTTEYQLDFTPLLSSSLFSPNIIEVYGSGSAFNNTNNAIGLGKKLGTVSTTDQFTKYDAQQINFNPDSDGKGYLMFAVYQGNWDLSNISLRASSETAFSPNEITVNVSMPTILANDIYEFKFEFYDINNKFVPVTVTAEKTFTGGTDLTGLGSSGTANSFFVTADSTIFSFGWDNTYDFSTIFTDKPKPKAAKTVGFLVQQVGYTGSTGILITSQAFDSNNNYITPGAYTGFQYPGYLNKIDATHYQLTVENFTGSLDSTIDVKRVAYTASLIGVSPTVQDVFNIYKVIEGTPGSDGKTTHQYILKPKNGTAIKNSNPSQLLELQLTKIESGSLLDVTSGNVKIVTGSSNTIVEVGLGVSAGTNGVHYNPIFSAAKITGSLVVSAYDFDNSVLVDTITLADVTDGITTGYIEASNGLILKRNPNNGNTYNPTSTTLSASFFDNFGKQYSSSIIITPNYSSGDQLKYQVGITDPNIVLNSVKGVDGTIFTVNTFTNAKGAISKFTFTEPTSKQTITVSETVAVAVDGAIFSATLSNDNATLPALSNGFVASSSFALTSGSVSVTYGNSSISYSNPIANNTFIVTINASSNVLGANVDPVTGIYSITQLTADAGSITLQIIFKDNDGITTTLLKTVTYSKSKAGVDGGAGTVGPGLVFVGPCSGLATSWVFQSDSITRQIVSDDSNPVVYYYLNAAANGLTKLTTGCPPNPTYFTALQSFASVATDILLAKDATILRTLVMGQWTGSVPYSAGIIRSANATDALTGKGFYLSAEGDTSFRIGDPATNYLYWNGTQGTLTLSGSITTTSAQIGNWQVSPTGPYAGALTDATQAIILDPNKQEVSLNVAGSKKVTLNAGPLTNVSAGSIAYTPNNTNGLSVLVTTHTTDTNTVQNSGYTGGGNGYGSPTYVTIPVAAIYSISGISTLSSFPIERTDLYSLVNGVNQNATSNPPNNQPDMTRMYYGGGFAGARQWAGSYTPRSVTSTLYLEAVRYDNNVVISRTYIESINTSEPYVITNVQHMVNNSGVFSWVSDPNISGPAVSNLGTRNNPVSNINISLPATNVYFRYTIVVQANSGAWYDITLPSFAYSPSYLAGSFKQMTNVGVSGTGNSTSMTVNVPVNINEFTAGGIQIASSTANYVKMERTDTPAGLFNMITMRGGKFTMGSAAAGFALQTNSSAEQLILCYSRATFGYVEVYGDLVANISDARLKKNFSIIKNALQKVSKIDGLNFNWNDKAYELMGKSTGSLEVGLIAQQVQEVLPEVVKLAPIDADNNGESKSGNNYLTIQYEKIVPLLIEAIKELKIQLDDLKNRP